MLLSWSLAISLAIVLVITRSPASGFVVRRFNTSVTSDMDVAEGSLLEVKYDLKTPKYENKTESAVIALKEDSNITNNATANKVVEQPVATTKTSITENSTKHEANITDSISNLIINTSTQAMLAVTENYTDVINASISNTTTESTTSASTSTVNPDIDFKSTSLMITDNEKQKILSNESTTTDAITTSTQNDTFSKSEHLSKDNFTNEVNDTSNMETSFTKMMNNATSEEVTPLLHTDLIEDDNTITVASLSSVKETTLNKVNIETSSHPDTAKTVKITSPEVNKNTYPNVHDPELTVLTESYKNINSDITTNKAVTEANIETKTKTFTDSKISESSSIDTTREKIVTTTLPSWKTYKTIERTRPTTTGTEKTTLFEEELTRAETSRISLEQAFSNTSIQSLEELKNELLNRQVSTTTTPHMSIATEKKTTSSPKFKESTTTQKLIKEMTTQTARLEIVSSKRAGYLDNTETTTVKQVEVTIPDYADKESEQDKGNFAKMYDTEGTEGDGSETSYMKNTTTSMSQSQLAEDAIKEELLMEKTIHENELLKQEVRKPHVNLDASNISLDHGVTLEMQEVITEDTLSVQPITPEKRKMTSLYTVSPNYKPLKKLDIQPSKQFVRDPDDNSWRNESISSLGIVFKPKNASKSFTEVLKNKTTELGNMTERGDKSDVPDLRVRLEKIAEVRKSKKKKVNMFGDTVYTDYEENSSENSNVSKEKSTTPMAPIRHTNRTSTTTLPSLLSDSDETIVDYISKDKYNIFKDEFTTPLTTVKYYNKMFNMGEYYDSADDYDADYATKIDLKKFSIPSKPKEVHTTPPPVTYASRPLELINTKPTPVTYMPDRQPTIQYFPPTKKVKTTTTKPIQKVNMDEYDDEFKNKVNQFTFQESTKMVYDISTTTPINPNKFEYQGKQTTKPSYAHTPVYHDNVMDKNLYLTNQQRVTEPQGGFVPNDGSFNRASYVIKHYKDFINEAVKTNEDDKISDFLPYTIPAVASLQGAAMSDVSKFPLQKEFKTDEYDYNAQFRKDIVNRFVDNFNQNSDRFKVDFPILYNNSIVHRKVEDNGKVLASSSAFMKRLYESASPKPSFLSNVKSCDSHCENMGVVDLSPAYELHYYVPEQEEKEEIEPRTNTLPFRYRL